MERQTCLGERYIACGADEGTEVILEGTPGNAFCAYLNGADVTLYGNAQDATGDTMNSGTVTIHGNTGDAAGYAMRGGEIFVKGDAGYRAGIHMKAYREKVPVLIIGGDCGSFLGEYQAGGIIAVLGLGHEDGAKIGYFCGTGMHGGRIFLRTRTLPPGLPEQVSVSIANEDDMKLLAPHLARFCEKFDVQAEALDTVPFYVLSPNSKNPYKQLYTAN